MPIGRSKGGWEEYEPLVAHGQFLAVERSIFLLQGRSLARLWQSQGERQNAYDLLTP
jgi:hypothetical protein